MPDLPTRCNFSLFLFSVHMERCPSPTLQWSVPHFSCHWKPSPLQVYWGRWHHSCLLRLACLFTVCARVPIPPTLLELSTRQPLLEAFPSPRLLGRCCHSCLLWPASLFTVHLRECPSPTLQSSVFLALFATCLFFSSAVCLLLSLFFLCFPWVGVSLSRGLR
jgi:hypothetical protein